MLGAMAKGAWTVSAHHTRETMGFGHVLQVTFHPHKATGDAHEGPMFGHESSKWVVLIVDFIVPGPCWPDPSFEDVKNP